MVLDENTAKFKISYDGETYYFCSLVCKKTFQTSRNKICQINSLRNKEICTIKFFLWIDLTDKSNLWVFMGLFGQVENTN